MLLNQGFVLAKMQNKLSRENGDCSKHVLSCKRPSPVTARIRQLNCSSVNQLLEFVNVFLKFVNVFLSVTAIKSKCLLILVEPNAPTSAKPRADDLK